MIHREGVTRDRLPGILEGCSQRVKEVVGAQITFTVKEMDEGYDIPARGEDSRGMGMDLLLRKGVYPYEYMNSIAKF